MTPPALLSCAATTAPCSSPRAPAPASRPSTGQSAPASARPCTPTASPRPRTPRSSTARACARPRTAWVPAPTPRSSTRRRWACPSPQRRLPARQPAARDRRRLACWRRWQQQCWPRPLRSARGSEKRVWETNERRRGGAPGARWRQGLPGRLPQSQSRNRDRIRRPAHAAAAFYRRVFPTRPG